MNSDVVVASSLLAQSPTTHPLHGRPTVSWGAILAGLAAAIALEVLFVMLGAGLGFALYTPLTDENPIANLGAGAVVIQGISAVFSLWFGGWIAGRFTPVGNRLLGSLHGFLVWSAATLAGIAVVAAGAGWALGDLSKVLGGGLSAAGKPAAAAVSGAADVGKAALKQSADTLSSFVDEAVAGRSSTSTPNSTIRAKREIGAAVGRVFTNSDAVSSPASQAALVKALVDNSNLSEAEASKMVADWTASYDRLKADLAAAKAEAEAKARVAADKAADAMATVSFCAFVAFALGALAASYGGEHGAMCAIRRHGRPEVVV